MILKLLCRLVTGILQLAEGSHLTINEIPLQPGTLNSKGCENAHVLEKMVESQKVLSQLLFCLMIVVSY